MKKLLIVVDFQKDFVDGALGFAGAAGLGQAIADKIEKYRAAGDDVAFTFDTHGEDYLNTQEGKNLPVAHCLAGSAGWQLHESVAPLLGEGDLRFLKPCFGSAELFDHLRETPYESIELVGLVSNICVIANAVLAKTAQPETPCFVDAACVASFDDELNDAALAVMAGMQIHVLGGRAQKG